MADDYTPGQKQAIEDLKNIEAHSGGKIILNGISHFRRFLRICLWIDFKGAEKHAEGAPIEDTEEVLVIIPPDFPFSVPICRLDHDRFAGHPHVSFKHYPCLYLAPDSQYEPSNGIIGYLARLIKWFEDAAANNLDPIGAPLHPPAAFASTSECVIIPTANTPPLDNGEWIGYAKCRIGPIYSPMNAASTTLEIIEWIKRDQVREAGFAYAYVHLFSQHMPYEYPESVGGLIDALSSKQVNRNTLLASMLCAASINESDLGIVIIGSPMRGIAGSRRRQHLAGWSINTADVRELKAVAKTLENKGPLEIDKIIATSANRLRDAAKVNWCQIMENRPEITIRRDIESPLEVFRNKSVIMVGCGAIGSHLAEYLARIGVGKLILIDNKRVTPGLLSRQNYSLSDIGKYKSEVMFEKIKSITATTHVQHYVDNFQNMERTIEELARKKEVDFVIDCTASKIVLLYFEHLIRKGAFSGLQIFSLVFGANAQSSMVLYRGKDYRGGLFDISRKALLGLIDHEKGNYFVNQFWPDRNDQKDDIFQPEPGCSDPTFRGSVSDVCALVASMSNAMASEILRGSPASASFSVQPHMFSERHGRYPIRYDFKNDIVIHAKGEEYEIRIKESEYFKMFELGNEVRKKKGPKHETGGIVYGQIDNATRIIWVTKVTPPPPDSEEKPNEFISGIKGVKEESDYLSRQSRGCAHFIGFWHTHPGSTPSPSQKDALAVAEYLVESNLPVYRTLLLIVNPEGNQDTLGGYVGKLEKGGKGRCVIIISGDIVDGKQ